MLFKMKALAYPEELCATYTGTAMSWTEVATEYLQYLWHRSGRYV